MSASEKKLCKDCKHYDGIANIKPRWWNLFGFMDGTSSMHPDLWHRCYHEECKSPITGGGSLTCYHARTRCMGNWWEKK